MYQYLVDHLAIKANAPEDTCSDWTDKEIWTMWEQNTITYAEATFMVEAQCSLVEARAIIKSFKCRCEICEAD
jgi:hypothetical protein